MYIFVQACKLIFFLNLLKIDMNKQVGMLAFSGKNLWFDNR